MKHYFRFLILAFLSVLFIGCQSSSDNQLFHNDTQFEYNTSSNESFKNSFQDMCLKHYHGAKKIDMCHCIGDDLSNSFSLSELSNPQLVKNHIDSTSTFTCKQHLKQR